MSALSAALRSRMTNLGVSENALADRAAIPRSTLHRRLADPRSFYLDEIERVADALEIKELPWLIGLAGR